VRAVVSIFSPVPLTNILVFCSFVPLPPCEEKRENYPQPSEEDVCVCVCMCVCVYACMYVLVPGFHSIAGGGQCRSGKFSYVRDRRVLPSPARLPFVSLLCPTGRSKGACALRVGKAGWRLTLCHKLVGFDGHRLAVARSH